MKWSFKDNPYQTGSNLPVLYTLPGNKIAPSYIDKHTHILKLNTKSYFLHAGEKNLSCDKILILNEYNPMEESSIPINPPLKYILKQSKTRATHPQKENAISLSTCGDCEMQNPATGKV